MRAAVYYETGGPEVFRYAKLPDPPCHPRGLVIDVEAISIEGGDVLHRAGGEMTDRPHVVGYQCAGTVREGGAHRRITAMCSSVVNRGSRPRGRIPLVSGDDAPEGSRARGG